MDKFINKTKSFIFLKQESIFSSAIIIATMIGISRLFGFFRYRILAGYFTKEQLDVFFASFRIPDLIFEILITGALTTSFIPIFIKYQKNKEELNKNISSIINLISLSMVGFILITVIFADQLIPLITPGYSAAKINQIVLYSRWLLLGQLPFLILGNFLTGIGQANKIFFLSAMAPIVYDLSIIIATYFFSASFGLSAPILGVVIGAVLFFLVQIPILPNVDFQFKLIIKKSAALVEFFRMVVPRALTVIATQIDATIDLTLTTFLGSGAYTIFYLAQRLQLLPVSVIGIAFGQASLPYISEIYQAGKIEELKKIVIDSILNLIFFVVPIASFFIFARTPLVRFFYGGQKFDWEATVQTAITLSWFAISIPFHTVYYFITRCFYALIDSRTPFFVSITFILINLTLSLLLILVFKLPVWALSISFSTSITLQVIVLFFLFQKKIGKLDMTFLLTELFKMGVAVLLSSVFNYFLMKLLDGLVFDTSRTINVILLLAVIGVVHVLLYLFLSWLLDVKEIYLVSKLIVKAKEYQKKFQEVITTYE